MATRHKVTPREESGIPGGHDRVAEQIEGERRFARVRRNEQALKCLLSVPAQVPSEPIRRPTKPSAPGMLSDGECARRHGEKCGYGEVLRCLAQPRGCVWSDGTTATEDADEEPLLRPRFGHKEPKSSYYSERLWAPVLSTVQGSSRRTPVKSTSSARRSIAPSVSSQSGCAFKATVMNVSVPGQQRPHIPDLYSKIVKQQQQRKRTANNSACSVASKRTMKTSKAEPY